MELELKKAAYAATDLSITNRVKLAKALLKRGVSNYAEIVNKIHESGLQNNYFTIIVESNPLRFNPQNGVDEMQHSWAGGKSDRQTVTVLTGDIVPGSIHKYEYYQNGNLTDSQYEEEDADFTIALPQSVIIQHEVDDHFNNNSEYYVYAQLVIYQPALGTLKEERQKKLEALKILGF